MASSPSGPSGFDPDNLIKSVIAIPLLKDIEADPAAVRYVILDLNFRHAEGRRQAKTEALDLIEKAIQDAGDPNVEQGAHKSKTEASQHYVYARLQGKVIRRLVEQDENRTIFHIWPDFIVRAQIWKSVATVKGDACRRAFATTGKGIVWAILDSGIDFSHPHFTRHGNLKELPPPVTHMDFS